MSAQKVDGPEPIRPQTPGSQGPSAKIYKGRAVSPMQVSDEEARMADSFGGIAKIVDELKSQVFSHRSETSEDALRTLKEMNLYFSELARGGDSQASEIAEHVQNVLMFIEEEKKYQAQTEKSVEEVRAPEVRPQSVQEKAQAKAAELRMRFENGPVNEDLRCDVESFGRNYIDGQQLPDTVKNELAQSLMKSALQACERERLHHKKKAPSPQFYIETLPAIQEAVRLGMSAMKYTKAHEFLEEQKTLLQWLQEGRDAFYHARLTQRYQFERPIPAQTMTLAERTDHERALLEGLPPEDRAIAEPWFNEFAKFDNGIFERFRMDVDRSGPHNATVNGKKGVVMKVSEGDKRVLFVQWCRLLDAAIKDVKEKDRPQWRAAMASLIFGASGDPCDKLASQVQEGLPRGQESPTFFRGSEGHPVVSVNVRKGTCTLQRTRTAEMISVETGAAIEKAEVTTVQTTRVGDPTRVQYGVQWRRA